MLGLVLQGENLESGLWLLEPVTVMLEHHSNPEGIIIQKLFPLSWWCQQIIGTDMVVAVVY